MDQGQVSGLTKVQIVNQLFANKTHEVRNQGSDISQFILSLEKMAKELVLDAVLLQNENTS